MSRSIGPGLRKQWRRACLLPGGKWLFSRMLGLRVPYSGSLGAVVQSLEHAKYLVRILHVKADPIVSDIVDMFSVCLLAAYLNDGSAAVPRELDRIGEEVGIDCFEQVGVSVAGWEVVECDLGLTDLWLRRHFCQDCTN